jgi:hypothetical protein
LLCYYSNFYIGFIAIYIYKVLDRGPGAARHIIQKKTLYIIILFIMISLWVISLVDWPSEIFTPKFWSNKPEDVRNGILVFGGGMIVVLGLILAGIRTHASDVQSRVAEQGHITDRFTKAIEQLGNEKLEVRLGSIYALERIAHDSSRDHWPIMETLTAYIRENSPWPPRETDPERSLHAEIQRILHNENPAANVVNKQDVGKRDDKQYIRTDIQAILTVIGRRSRKHEKRGSSPLELVRTNLQGARLIKAHLERAVLFEAHLEGAGSRSQGSPPGGRQSHERKRAHPEAVKPSLRQRQNQTSPRSGSSSTTLTGSE